MPPSIIPLSMFRGIPRISRSFGPAIARQSGISTNLLRTPASLSARFNSSNSRPLYESAPKTNSHKPHTSPKVPKPEYEMTFTCKPCSTRSTHRVSKQGYHYGSVLITCPECRNRHVISDHLNIFGDRHLTIEDLMKERGQLVKKGTLSEDGDVEFWEDGTTTKRDKASSTKSDDVPKGIE